MRKLCFIILMSCLIVFCGKSESYSMNSDKMVREPAVAGQFYPANPQELGKMIDAFLAAAKKIQSTGEPVAFLAPHAGYVFSGPVAAHVYKQIEGQKVDTVILLGLAHSYPLEGGAVYASGAFRSPFGDVSIDDKTAQKLLARSKDLIANAEAHAGEHSLETQIPFLQHVLKDFKIVPVVMGNPDPEIDKKIGEDIAEVIRDNESKGIRTILIGSTDMAHYPDAQHANESDLAILQTIESMDPEALLEKTHEILSKRVPEFHVTLCGEGVTIAVMAAAKKLGVMHAAILNHATSADSPYGNQSKTVGYGAVMFAKESSAKLYSLGTKETFSISPETQNELLAAARGSIEQFLKTGTKTKSEAKELKGELAVPSAVFVTLMKNGELRGCIGTIEADKPLLEAVRDYAVSAATQDPRFSKLSLAELQNVQIEISVLSPIKSVQNHEEIIPNISGVIVENGGKRGLFLPQVWEHVNGNKEEFMNLLCSEKAGLPASAWKDSSTKLYTFTVFSFQE